MSLNCKVVEGPPAPQAFLSGAIDEHTDLATVFARLEGIRSEQLILNLEGVIRINSIGLRHWIPLLSKLTRTRSVVLDALSYPLVLQANNIANMLSSARVRSCLAPYYCTMCEISQSVLVHSEEVRGNARVPTKPCPQCGEPMDFDELDDYFAFLRRGA